MEKFNEILGVIDNAVWGIPLMVLILAGGFFADGKTQGPSDASSRQSTEVHGEK